jgi:NADPH-dependent ferric siderophore reductase
VRSFDPDKGELAIDFVYHGDEGVAGPWAAQAEPGQQLQLLGPGGAFAPDPDADWHLLVGDEAAFPAIASALAEIPDRAGIVAVLEIGDAADADYLDLPDRADVRWLRRGSDPSLVDAVRALTFPAGSVQAFVHGELGAVRLLRGHLLHERNLPPDHVSISGYWRHGKDEDGFQADKREDSRRVAG